MSESSTEGFKSSNLNSYKNIYFHKDKVEMNNSSFLLLSSGWFLWNIESNNGQTIDFWLQSIQCQSVLLQLPYLSFHLPEYYAAHQYPLPVLTVVSNWKVHLF